MLDLTNVITITVSQPGNGLGLFNVNNILLLTSDPFLVNPSSDVYRVYTSPGNVGTDFGVSSETAQQANAVFAQQPNILAGGGQLIIAPLITAEDMVTAIARLNALVSFCGILSTVYPTGSTRKTLADAVQAYGNKILFLPSATYADVAGVFTDIKAASDTRTRCLLYTPSALGSRLFAAAYAGRGMSVDFTGSNTAITMNLKQLATISPDEGITQAYWNAAKAAGVDVYCDYDGYASCVSNGANGYFDDVYNLIWLVSTLRITGFNALATVSTKIPQTEPGMSLLKSAFRGVVEQAVKNGYVAPGAWNSAEWFGTQEDMINNIQERGYYIYSAPVNQQLQADRVARKAPLIQIAIKLAGAIQSINVLVSINA